MENASDTNETGTAGQEMTVWVITDGRAGNVVSARGLADAVGLPYVEKVIALARPHVWMPPALWVFRSLGIDRSGSDPVEPPWPDLIISCGRRAVGTVLEIKRRSGGRTHTVHIQDPHVDLSRFDLIAAPAHDNLSGPNVVTTLGGLNSVNGARLSLARDNWRDRLQVLPEPRIAVLIGGRSRAYDFTRADAEMLAGQLLDLQRATGGGLMITASRRTGADAGELLRERLSGADIDFWDGQGDNPYLGYLAWADHLIVTGDSVNMTSEALATGRPVHTVAMRPIGNRAKKFECFHESLRKAGLTRPFDGTLTGTARPPLRETETVAARVREMILRT